MEKKIKIAVFVSGSGTNLQSIIDRCADGTIPAQVELVVSSRADAYGLVRAAKAGIDGVVYRRQDFPDGNAADLFLLNLLDEYHIDLIALAGYLKMISSAIIKSYRHRVVNIHPGLLPKYGGQGMYGEHVHQAVIAAKEKESGVTVHFVDEIYDHGLVLAQKKVPVLPEDSPETLARRVLEVEHTLYPEVLRSIAENILKEKTS